MKAYRVYRSRDDEPVTELGYFPTEEAAQEALEEHFNGDDWHYFTIYYGGKGMLIDFDNPYWVIQLLLIGWVFFTILGAILSGIFK